MDPDDPQPTRWPEIHRHEWVPFEMNLRERTVITQTAVCLVCGEIKRVPEYDDDS